MKPIIYICSRVSSHDLQGLSNNRPDRFRSAEIGKDILSETLSTGTNVRFAGGSSRHSADARKAFLPKHSTSRSSASSRPAAPTLKPPRPHSTDVKLCKALYDFSSEYADTFSFQAEQGKGSSLEVLMVVGVCVRAEPSLCAIVGICDRLLPGAYKWKGK